MTLLNATHLYPQIVEKNIDDTVVVKCLEELFQTNHFSDKKSVISVYENEPTELGERVLVISTFLVDREDIDSNIGRIIGFFRENVVVYKSYKEKINPLNSLEVEKMRDGLDNYLLGNKAAYIANEKIISERFIDKEGNPIKLDKPKSKRIAYVKGFLIKVIIKKNQVMEISHF